MSTISVQLPGLDLKNPIIPASGTAAYGQGLAQQFDLNELGALVIKSTTLEPRTGNPKPNVTETPAGWMNAIGLTNPGIEAVMADRLPWLATHYPDLPIIGSVAGSTFTEYVAVAQRLTQASNVHALEINISCPNVAAGGLAFGTDPELVQNLVAQVVAVATKPVYVKLTPNVTDITVIAQAAVAGGASGLTMINTLTGLQLDLTTRQPTLSNGTGGLSGAAIHPLAVRMVHQVRAVTDVPIIGVGGVMRPEDAIEFFLAGANAVQVGAATYGNPCACRDIARALPTTLAKYHLPDLMTLTREQKIR
ncbi:dihydroorotate dehydrogenase [Levilactobacillus wangkuiensis]|uniref:dihydroorotate dehydrogenase n=1 Tax=Levilactobacillus wangkuiensis TaxID=2799566 RepID=UPI00194501FA|nr:dihydroorotate dehydrogenase [Levilactobacillus wangkuiensis]